MKTAQNRSLGITFTMGTLGAWKARLYADSSEGKVSFYLPGVRSDDSQAFFGMTPDETRELITYLEEGIRVAEGK